MFIFKILLLIQYKISLNRILIVTLLSTQSFFRILNVVGNFIFVDIFNLILCCLFILFLKIVSAFN